MGRIREISEKVSSFSVPKPEIQSPIFASFLQDAQKQESQSVGSNSVETDTEPEEVLEALPQLIDILSKDTDEPFVFHNSPKNKTTSKKARSKQQIQSSYLSLIESEAKKKGLDPALVKAVVKAESNFNPKAKSPVGAQGLMQLMPATAKLLGVKDILDPKENIEGGTSYLKDMLEIFKDRNKAVAAYNAGPGAVKKYGGIPPYSETQDYVKKVNKYYKQFKTE
jgi:soluble lytic murein transglycosylase-like protein